MSTLVIDDLGIDDMFLRGVDVHLERMDTNYYWLGITLPDGRTVHIDIHGKRRIDAVLREGRDCFDVVKEQP